MLRICECGDCNALIHPPQPVCRYCRSHNMGVREVSGRAVLAGFTVNHRFSLPGLPAPYVVAQVALEEDPRVRLTTNILVDIDLDGGDGSGVVDLELGQIVQVEFEKADDVYLPLFRPVTPKETGALPTDEIAPEDFSKHVRPMARQEKFEDKAAITGIGASRMGRRLMVPPLSLTIEACEAAIADAGLTMADIDGLSTYPGLDVAGMGEGGVSALEGALGIQPTWINGGMDTFGPGGSVIAAVMAVATGMARHVLCFRTLWEATFSQLLKEGKAAPPGGMRTTNWQAPFGATSAAHTLALNAQRHFHRYGTTRETLGWIALNQRANAALNPTAIYRDPMTMADYLSARLITTPFGLYDCDVPCDGAVAVIVSAVDTAADLAKPPVYFEAVGTQIIERTDWDQTTLTHEPQVLGQSAHLWTRTSLRPDDVDVAELYDGFSFNCLSWLEALGFCGIGEAKDFLDGGANIARDGVIPLNTHGGQLARPHARHGPAPRGGHAAARRGRRPAGRRRTGSGGQQRRPDPERSDAAPGRRVSDAAAEGRSGGGVTQWNHA